MKAFKISLYLLVLILLSRCATSSRPIATEKARDQGPVFLELRPVSGQKDVTEYKSRTITKSYSLGQLAKKVSESVDFTVSTQVLQVDPKSKVANYRVSTIRKDGKADLSDFAMPEIDESIDFLLTRQAEVVRAGLMPQGSIYYVAPISLPKEKVKVGDSWPFHAEWMSMKTGVPLKMQIISILKSIRQCGESGLCAEIEISGDVGIIGASDAQLSSRDETSEQIKMRFRSNIQGRVLFSINKGIVLYSLIRSDEYLSGIDDSVEISSCMLSYVTHPEKDRVMQAENPNCDPTASVPAI